MIEVVNPQTLTTTVTVPQFLTINETAKLYNLASCCLRRWDKEGKLPTISAGTRKYVNVAMFEDFLARMAQRDSSNLTA